MARSTSLALKPAASKSTPSKSPASKSSTTKAVRPSELRLTDSSSRSNTAKEKAAHADQRGTIAVVKQRAVHVGEAVITWGNAHPFQAALAAAAVVAGVAALVSFARHRRASTVHQPAAPSPEPAALTVEDLVTSHVTTPHIPEAGHGRSSNAIMPTRERTSPSHHFRPIRIP